MSKAEIPAILIEDCPEISAPDSSADDVKPIATPRKKVSGQISCFDEDGRCISNSEGLDTVDLSADETYGNDPESGSRGPFLTSTLGENFDHRGEVVPQG
jgi:hypothetical protein